MDATRRGLLTINFSTTLRDGTPVTRTLVDAAEVVFPATRFTAWCIVAIAVLLSTDATCAESKQLALVGGMLLDGSGGASVHH
jgi:hypothetical protein